MSPLNTIPLLACAVAFALGIAGAAMHVLPDMAWLLVFGLGLLAVAVGLWHAHRRLVSLGPLLHTTALLVVVLAAGGLRHTTWQAPSPQSLRTLPDSLLAPPLTATLIGTAQGPITTTNGSARFVFDADRIATETDTLLIHDSIQVRWRLSPWADTLQAFPPLVAGERWQMQGLLRAPPDPRNPADFDYGAYLRHQGIHWTLHVNDPADVTRMAAAPSSSYNRLVHRARAAVYARLERYVATDAARGIQQALLLGDRTDVDRTHRIHFAATGLMHLLAVSGLHVLLVGMIAYQLLRPLLMRLGWPRRRVDLSRAAFTLLLLLTYVALTGGRPSVIRATIMATLLIGGELSQRSYASLNALGAAGLILLWMRPTALYDPGFQLSFAAVGGIVLFNPKLMQIMPAAWTHGTARRTLTQSVTVSTAALIGTTPFLLMHFGFVSAAGILLNVIAIPLTGLALAAGIMTIATSAVPPVATLFGASADVLTQALILTATWGADAFGHWQWAVPHVPGLVVALMGGVLVIFGGMRNWRAIHGALAVLTIGVFMVWVPLLSRPITPTLDILFFDVGQSDAALVSTPDGRHLLVDAGLRTPHTDAATFTVLPHLRYSGIRTLDAVLVTHPDADHLGGVPTLLRAGVVHALWDNGQPDDGRLYQETVHLVDSLDTAHRAVQQEDTLHLGDHVMLAGLGPPLHPDKANLHGANEQSTVTMLRYGSVRVLFTGDAEGEAERWLLETYGSALQSDVVTVPHHGSRTSSSSSFVDAVSHPQTHAVISAGERNMFGFPDTAVQERWQQQSGHLHSTAGRAVWLRTDGQSVWEVDW